MGHRSGIPFSPRGRMSHRGLTSGGGPCGATRRRTSRTQMQRIMHRSPGTNVLNGRTGNPDHRPDDHYGSWILDVLLWTCLFLRMLEVSDDGWLPFLHFPGILEIGTRVNGWCDACKTQSSKQITTGRRSLLGKIRISKNLASVQDYVHNTK